MKSSPFVRSLLAASLCLAPLGWAAAQDQQQQPPDQQHQRDHQEQEQHRPQQQQHPPPQQPHAQQAPQNNAPPQGQHAGGTGGGNPQFQHPGQTHAATPSPPAGATASPAPPAGPSQFQRVQGPPQHQNNGAAAPAAAPAATAPQQQQQFQQRSVQRGGAPVGSASPQAQTQQQAPQQTTTRRGNVQGAARSTNTAAFIQQHGGYAPTQFDRGHFYGHDYAHFSPHETRMWHSGGWHHEFHDGRYGWWYAVDDIWYFYDAPVYPYPTYIPDVVYIPEEDDAPPPDYVDAPYAPAPALSPYGQPPAYYYYFCQDTRTYYPYVTSCASPWQPVPAAPTPPQ